MKREACFVQTSAVQQRLVFRPTILYNDEVNLEE
jgi:hypothetical protein